MLNPYSLSWVVVTLLIFGPCPPSEAARLVNVAFQSNATSGNMLLHGTIVYPDGAPPAGGYPPAILIGGSGPGNRWLNATASYLSTQLPGELPTQPYGDYHFCYFRTQFVSPYYDITTWLADSAGMAVLTWDKRTCLVGRRCNGGSCGCQNVPCATSKQTNCLHVGLILNTDFIDDSINALSYLLFSQTLVKVDPTRAAVLGHSAGAVQAPIVALNFTAAHVKQVVLLAGPASPILTTTSRQLATQAVESTAWVNGSICNASVPQQAQLLNILASGLPSSQAALQSINEQNALLASGYYNATPPFTPVSIAGVVAPLLFWQQAIAFSTFQSAATNIQAYLTQSQPTTLLAINSDQDLEVSPYEFFPLRAILGAFPSSAQGAVIPYLTHFLTDSSNLDSHVSVEPLELLKCYFTASHLRSCVAQGSAAKQRTLPSRQSLPSNSEDEFVLKQFTTFSL